MAGLGHIGFGFAAKPIVPKVHLGAIFGGTPMTPDLPLIFNSSHKVGLGLYNQSFTIAIATDIGMLLLGVVFYAFYRIKLVKQK